MTDEGLQFRAVLRKADGALHARETDDRYTLLAWIAQHHAEGDVIVELEMTARGPAVDSMYAALVLGLRRTVMP